MKKYSIIIPLAILSIFVISLLAGSFVVVESGNVGVVTHFGAVQNDILPEGMHFVVPYRTKVVQLNARIKKINADAKASSKDLQNVTSSVALNYYLDKNKANIIYQNLGLQYERSIIDPTIQESIKAVTAEFTAEELITRRTDVKNEVFNDIKKRLGVNNIIVTDFSIVDFDFSEEFNRAIEAKQIAEQRALTAKNDLSRIETEAEQVEAKAKGEALAKIAIAKADAESQVLLAKSITKEFLQLKTIEKWDGVMPVVVGENSGSFFDVVGAAKAAKKK